MEAQSTTQRPEAALLQASGRISELALFQPAQGPPARGGNPAEFRFTRELEALSPKACAGP